ncbi:MAG: energy-coupling factor ABC transporter permease [Opitutales bacterium]
MHLVEATSQSVPVIATQSLGLAALAWAGFRLKKSELSKDRLGLTVALTLLVLAGQAVNISMGASHSGHFLGTTLLTILLGPAIALLSMAAVLTVQAVAFADGSIATLGANFLAIGVVPVAITAGLMRVFKSQGRSALGFAASFASVVAGALTLAVIMGTQYQALFVNHISIGLLEAAMTVGMLALFGAAKSNTSNNISLKPIAAAIIIFACALPFSSELPDGLEVTLEETTES